MSEPRLAWQRILLKISGEGLCKPGGFGIDPDEVDFVASETSAIHKLGVQVALVVGGGNIVRGSTFAERGVNKASADQMGMLATVINAIALQSSLEGKFGVETRVMTAISMEDVAEPYIRRRAIRHLETGKMIILAAGTGNPYFTTDTAAALRACEIGCEVLLKATKVDGVFNADPVRHPDAVRYDHLSFMKVLRDRLRVMDSTAISMCMDNNLPIIIFNLKKQGNIRKVVTGEKVGTLVNGD
ncbi:MAG TPA: UMP kinase [Planctomycetota bacterium]|nr:UMP kinase [Planctomycetota bacterium]